MRLIFPLFLSLFTSTLALKGASYPSNLSRRRVQESEESGPAKAAGPKESDEVATLTDKKAAPPKDSGAGLVSKDKADKTDKADKGKKDKKDKKDKKCKKAKKEPKRRLQSDMAPVQPPDMSPDSLPGAGPMSVSDSADAAVEEMPYCLHGEETAKACAAIKEGKPPKKGNKKVDGDLSLEITHDGDKSSEEVAAKVGDILRSETPLKFLGCAARRRLIFGDDKESDSLEDIEEGEEDEEEAVSVVGLDFGTSTSQECKSRGFLSGSSEDCGQVISDVKIFFDGKNKPTKDEKTDMFDLLIATVESLAAEGAFDEVGTVQKVGSSASSSGSGGATVPIVAAVVAAAAVIGAGAFLYKRQRTTKQRSTEKGGETDESDDEVVEARVIMVEDEENNGKDGKKKKYEK